MGSGNLKNKITTDILAGIKNKQLKYGVETGILIKIIKKVFGKEEVKYINTLSSTTKAYGFKENQIAIWEYNFTALVTIAPLLKSKRKNIVVCIHNSKEGMEALIKLIKLGEEENKEKASNKEESKIAFGKLISKKLGKKKTRKEKKVEDKKTTEKTIEEEKGIFTK